MKKKRLRRNKQQGMTRRRIAGKKPMSAEQKLVLKKAREAVKAASDAAKAK